MQNGKARQRIRYKTRHMQEANSAAAMGIPPRNGDEDPTKGGHPIYWRAALHNNIILEVDVRREI